MPDIALHHVSKRYDPGAAPAVADLDLLIDEGEFMCLLGPSGCGKSTTLRLIAGLESLSEGEIRLGDRLVDSRARGCFVPAEQRNLGLVFQSYALWPHLTVAQYIEFGLKLRKQDAARRRATLDQVLQTLGIEAYRHRYPAQLSGGQQQRVALARMLAVQPEILLLDEPLSNLDARLRLEMRTELKRIHRQLGTTMLFVTHDQWEAMALATRIAVMKDGQLQQLGTPHEIYETPANRFVAEFVGTPPINLVELSLPSPLASQLTRYLGTCGRWQPGIEAVGIRPERIQVLGGEPDLADPALLLSAHLTSLLPTGGSWILELTVAGDRLHLCTQTPPSWAEGASLWLRVRAEDLHLFDSQGRRLAAPRPAAPTPRTPCSQPVMEIA